MNALRLVGRLLFVMPLALALASCSDAKPTKWTLWYIPNEPPAGAIAVTPNPCHTYVFASAPNQGQFAVAQLKGSNGADPPRNGGIVSHTGETFSGSLGLGRQLVHDESTGADINVNVVYVVQPYVAAKARADADCPPVQAQRPAPSAAVKPAVKKTPIPPR